ncbi:MAG: ribosome recycling factor [candidate division Zixibacteria bacterium]|nr:ribosome recycling factor [candidate division Zixibacteria bacterium]
MTDKIYNDSEEKMKKSYQSIQKEFAGLRTGKASASLLDNVRVDYHGTIRPLNQLASISAPEIRLLIVQAWDKTTVGEISKSIQKADLGLNPQVEGKKDKAINEDDHKKGAEKIQKLTDHYISMIDDLMGNKEKEIMEV